MVPAVRSERSRRGPSLGGVGTILKSCDWSMSPGYVVARAHREGKTIPGQIRAYLYMWESVNPVNLLPQLALLFT